MTYASHSVMPERTSQQLAEPAMTVWPAPMMGFPSKQESALPRFQDVANPLADRQE